MSQKQFLNGILLVATTLLVACSGDSESIKSTPKKAVLAAPFRFQRSLEVKPGLTFDVLTWGRGKDSTSALLILRSDSTHQKFKALTADLVGKPLEVWDMDLDTDGNPELAVQVILSTGVNDLYIYEFDASGTGNAIRFPSFSDKAKAGFKGKDSIYIKEGELRRDFLYQEPASTEKPTKRTLAYHLRNNTFQISEISNEPKKK
ncbi:MAG: hypothetical protein ACKOWL_02115 [Sphingobacteriaceae bacterium]